MLVAAALAASGADNNGGHVIDLAAMGWTDARHCKVPQCSALRSPAVTVQLTLSATHGSRAQLRTRA
jgi:hypothetical protein